MRRHMLSILGSGRFVTAGVASAALALLAAHAHAEEFALGSDSAEVTIVEYASMSCSHCATFHREVLPWLKETYIDTGTVRLVFRDFPLNRSALFGAMLVHCAGPDDFFSALDVLFRKQESWAFAENAMVRLRALASEAGVGGEAFDRCMADKELQLSIVEARATAQEEHEIKSTPSFLIGGKVYAGVLSPEQLTQLVEEARR